MTVLVTGGAGYIGSHMVGLLAREKRDVVVVDDLSSGHRDAVPAGVPFYETPVEDRAEMTRILRAHRVGAILHFASRIRVGESVEDPRLHYTGNLGAAITLLESALDAGVHTFVLSSSAAVYGLPIALSPGVPLDEAHPTSPINPYGDTKLAIEKMLASYAAAYGMKYVALRYFNAAGAGAAAGLGERHAPETHLIPIVIDAALGRLPHVVVNGDDYPTPDGTCIRDYVHVEDLADAHLAALDYLARGGESGPFNLGTGAGHSVRQVIDAVRAVSGRSIEVHCGARRPGDPPELVASAARAAARLGWKARRPSLAEIVRDAWAARSRDGG